MKTTPTRSGPTAFFRKTAETAGGFTLIEILLSIFIFSVVITTLFSSYRAVFSATESIDAGIDIYEMAATCLNRMTADLKSVYLTPDAGYNPPGTDDSQDPFKIKGDSFGTGSDSFGKLRFTSLAHIAMDAEMRNGVAEIVYYVQTTDDGQHLLKRADRLPPYPENFEPAGDPILCEHVKALDFLYYDSENNEYETWDSDGKAFEYGTPSAVKIKLTLGKAENDEYPFEILVALPTIREMRK